MKLGARIFKTGLAVVLALFVAELLNLPSPVFAGISAVFAIQPSIYRSYLTIIEQIQGNLIGAIIAIIFVLLLGNHFLVVGLAAIILIMINLKLKFDNTISLSVVTLIAIMETTGDDFITFAILRFATVMLGIFAAFLVNMIFLPPKYESKLYTSISDTTCDILRWIRISNHQAADHSLLKKDIDSLKDRLISLDQIYLFYKEDKKIRLKQTHTKLRKLVVYRQMLTVTRNSFDILKKLHHYENLISSLPETTAKQLQEKLEHLTTNHEHLLLRHIGKARQIHEEEMQEYKRYRQELLSIFQDYQKMDPDEESLPPMLLLTASLMDYNEQLEHLEILLNSYQEHHKDKEEEK